MQQPDTECDSEDEFDTGASDTLLESDRSLGATEKALTAAELAVDATVAAGIRAMYTPDPYLAGSPWAVRVDDFPVIDKEVQKAEEGGGGCH
jgi:hypothetical protein